MALHEHAAFLRPSDEAGQIFYPISEWHHTWPENVRVKTVLFHKNSI